MSINSFFWGGGGILGFFLGGECRSYFYGRADFSDSFSEGLLGGGLQWVLQEKGF